jgi:hypothetical protein
MPSALHEALVDLFRANVRLIELLTAPLLPPPTEGLGPLRIEDATLTDPRPLERRADLVIVPTHGPAFVVEVQLASANAKKWTWPSYTALARDRLQRDVVLVVLTLSETVAGWAREPIRLDPLGSSLCPLVMGPAQIPVIVDPAEALAAPERLVLCALAHGRGPSGEAIAALTAKVAPCLDEDRGRFYIDLVSEALHASARALLESAMFENYEYRSELFRKLVAQGKAEGEAKGKAEGKAEALVEAVLQVLGQRHIPVDPAGLARLSATTDPATLLRYLNRALSAASLDEVLDD